MTKDPYGTYTTSFQDDALHSLTKQILQYKLGRELTEEEDEKLWDEILNGKKSKKLKNKLKQETDNLTIK